MTESTLPLAGRTALVTGGSRGIGRAVARRLAADGAFVAVNYRSNQAAASDVIREIEASGGHGMAVPADIADPAAVRSMVDRVREQTGSVDLLISNAGASSSGKKIANTPGDEFRRMLELHALGPVRLIQELLPQMRERGRSDIIFISSIATSAVPSHSAPYTMAKAAAEAAALTLAKEEIKNGIHVNIVAPNLVATDMGKMLFERVTGNPLPPSTDGGSYGRPCAPEDMANIVAFLASRDAAYLTGQRIQADGGNGLYGS